LVTLGGGHSISYASIKAHAEKYPGISILQIDAHADLQEAYEGNPWSHASVMARVREIPYLSSIIAVGIRSMSQEEAQVVDRKCTFFGHQLDSDGIWIEKAINLLSDQVYITFDLDGFDSSLMPSTGTPEPGGLSWNQAMALLKKVAEKKKIVGFDVVELCPSSANVAPDYLAAKLVYKIISYHYFYHPMT
jgi:agmatinase